MVHLAVIEIVVVNGRVIFSSAAVSGFSASSNSAESFASIDDFLSDQRAASRDVKGTIRGERRHNRDDVDVFEEVF